MLHGKMIVEVVVFSSVLGWGSKFRRGLGLVLAICRHVEDVRAR